MSRQMQSVKTRSLVFSGDKAKSFFADARQIWQFQHKSDFVIKEHAEATGINETSYGEILRGKRRASLHQCLLIARDLDLSVEAVVRIEGYPDVKTLISLVEADETPRHPGEKESVLNTLRISLRSPAWQQADWHDVPFRQVADAILAMDLDAYTKAAMYADQVHYLSEYLKNMQPRWQRKTPEAFAAVS